MNYMRHIRGVDISNKFISEYEMHSKTLKWWKRIFFHLLDLSIVNSWILYVMQTGHKISQLDFRLSIIDYVRSIGQKTRNISKNFHLPIENELRKTCVQCSKMRKNMNEKVQKIDC